MRNTIYFTTILGQPCYKILVCTFYNLTTGHWMAFTLGFALNFWLWLTRANRPARKMCPQWSHRGAKLLSWQSAQYRRSFWVANGRSTSDFWQSQHWKHLSCQCSSLYDRSCQCHTQSQLHYFTLFITLRDLVI